MIVTCRTTVELLAAFLDGALPVEDEAALRAHLAACPRCVEFLESYRATGAVIREATEVALPDEVAARLAAFLRDRTR